MYQIGVALSRPVGRGQTYLRSPEDVDSNIEQGIEAFWEELRPGLATLTEQFGWCWIGRVTLRDFSAGDGAMSLEARRSLEVFLDQFMQSETVKDCVKFLFFVSDWPEDGEIRYGEGSVRDLGAYLRLFNGWDEWIYRSALKSFQQGQETPLLVRLLKDDQD